MIIRSQCLVPSSSLIFCILNIIFKIYFVVTNLLGDLKVLRSKYCKEQSKEKRGRGRPPISWTDDIKKVSGQGMKGATQMAGERVAWRALVKTTAALYSAT